MAAMPGRGGRHPVQVLSTYRYVGAAGEGGVEWLDLGLPTIGEKGPLARQVRAYLKSQEPLVDKLAPAGYWRRRSGPTSKRRRWRRSSRRS